MRTFIRSTVAAVAIVGLAGVAPAVAAASTPSTNVGVVQVVRPLTNSPGNGDSWVSCSLCAEQGKQVIVPDSLDEMFNHLVIAHPPQFYQQKQGG